MARMLAQAGDWAGSLEHAAAATRLSPENPIAAMLHLRAQMQLLNLGAIDQGQISDNARRDIQRQLSVLEGEGEIARLKEEVDYCHVLHKCNRHCATISQRFWGDVHITGEGHRAGD
ncbi:MAG: hypothetical protein GY809_15340 [Planctomycetes bacterium]|nr:hypothetical protein [Planctomycetota bacterium]